MLAIHGLHNSVETLLHAIALEYDIRGEKQLNISFEALLNDVAKSDRLTSKGIKLPYRSEIRNLNLARNLAIHHAHAPAAETLDDHRVMVSSFLAKAVQECFGVDFGQLDRSGFIGEESLSKIIGAAKWYFKEAKWSHATALFCVAARIAINYVARTLDDPRRPGSFRDHHLRSTRAGENEELYRGVEQLCEQVDAIQRRTTVLFAGVDISDYVKFEKIPIIVHFSITGYPLCRFSRDIEEQTATWVFEFVVDLLLRWQEMGLIPGSGSEVDETVDKWLAEFDGHAEKEFD